VKSTWQSAGRSSEVSWLTTDSIILDRHFHVVKATVPQGKVSKVKLAAFTAGVCQWDCWLVDFADKLTLENRPVFNLHEPYWLFPDLHDKVSASLPNV
jgi:hypothetical protein